jgi:microcystin-dependent protein
MKPNQDHTGRSSTFGARLQLGIVLAALLLCLPAALAQSVPDRLNYQGILLKGDGTPVPATSTAVEFRIWSESEGGTLLWSRIHTITPDANGAFNVVLMDGGSAISGENPPPAFTSLAPVFTSGTDARYLELTVQGSTAIKPRQRFVASPYAFLAQNVVAAKQNFEVTGTLTVSSAAHVESLTVDNAASVVGTMTASEFVGFGTIPIGGIIMWSGTEANVPTGWALCDGTQNTPDLRGRFVLGSGNGTGLTPRTPGQNGGEQTHTLTMAEMPSHNHAGTDLKHTHDIIKHTENGDGWVSNPTTAQARIQLTDRIENTGSLFGNPVIKTNTAGISIVPSGGDSAHTNMPPFYVLAYIMRVR